MSLPMEKSYYTAVASDAPIVFGESDRGNKQIAVEFKIEGHELYSGETITWIGFFTDKTAERTIESLQIAGWQGDDLSELDGVPGSEILRSEVSLACEPEEYDGRWTLKVQWVNRPGGGRFKFKQELTGNELKSFAAQMRATVKAVRGAGGAQRKPANNGSAQRPPQQRLADRHPNAPGGVDDDIPF